MFDAEILKDSFNYHISILKVLHFENNKQLDFMVNYSAFTETGATQTVNTNQKAELKQQIPTFSNPANQMPSTKQWNLNLFFDRWCLRDYGVG